MPPSASSEEALGKVQCAAWRRVPELQPLGSVTRREAALLPQNAGLVGVFHLQVESVFGFHHFYTASDSQPMQKNQQPSPSLRLDPLKSDTWTDGQSDKWCPKQMAPVPQGLNLSPIPGMLLKAGGIRNPDQGMGQGAPTTQNQACLGFPTCGGLLVQFPSHRLGASYVFERHPKALH